MSNADIVYILSIFISFIVICYIEMDSEDKRFCDLTRRYIGITSVVSLIPIVNTIVTIILIVVVIIDKFSRTRIFQAEFWIKPICSKQEKPDEESD